MSGGSLIEFGKYEDHSGSLAVSEFRDLPFTPQRAFWIYDVRGLRGKHALRTCHQVLIAVSGSFRVAVAYREGDLVDFKRWVLSSPHRGLYVPPMTWRTLREFSEGAVCLVLASHPYDPDDYIEDFLEWEKEVLAGHHAL